MNCFVCSKEVKFLNKPLFGSGKTLDNGQLCSKCFSLLLKKDNSYVNTVKNYSQSQILDILNAVEVTQETASVGALYTSKELSRFGNKSFQYSLIDKIGYRNGLDIFDQHKSKDNHPLIISLYGENTIVIGLIKLSNIYTAIDISDIDYVVIEPQQQVLMQKKKSVLKRAIVGGVLLGGVGAVVGAASGIGSKEIKLSDYPDNILAIVVKGEEILFSVENKNYSEVEKFFKNVLGKKYKNINEI